MSEYDARTVDACSIRTIKIYQEFLGRRANRYRAGPFGIIILIDERFILTLDELGGGNGEVFDPSAFVKCAAVGDLRHEVLPNLVRGYDRGADGFGAIEDAISGGETSTFMQRNRNASRALNWNGGGGNHKSDNGE